MRQLGNVIRNMVASWNITDAIGWVWGTATGGAKGPGTINAQGLFVNGSPTSTTQIVTLGSGSSRTSTTALAVDATLQIAVAVAGTYKVELYTPALTGMLSGQGGIQLMLGLSAANATSACNANATMLVSDGSGPLLANNLQGTAISNTIAVGNCAFFPAAAYAGGSPALNMSGIVTLNAATTIGVYWAQAASSATATTLNAGTTLVVTRIA